MTNLEMFRTQSPEVIANWIASFAKDLFAKIGDNIKLSDTFEADALEWLNKEAYIKKGE